MMTSFRSAIAAERSGSVASSPTDPGSGPTKQGDQSDAGRPSALSFGQFEFQPDRRLLLRAGEPIKIGGRAFDLLEAFVRRAGEIITKDELIALVWPNIFVHDANLKVTIFALRRILGDTSPQPTFIATIPGRGYRFIAPVVARADAAAEPPATSIASEPARLPEAGAIIGRCREIGETVGLLGQRRMVTLVGAGGVGKTTVAVAAANRAVKNFPDGVCFVDLSLAQDGHLVPTLLASALGVRGAQLDATQAILESIGGRKMLVLLDNCEHVVHVVRALAARMLGTGTGIRLLVTSREPIGAEEEAVVQIGALPFPEGGAAQTAEDALRYPSFELFLARAFEWSEYEFKPEHSGVVSEICRSLHGLPLALEIAAAQLDRRTPEELLEMLNQHLAAFDNRNAEAPPRQRTLWATLDWSYQLLSADEALIFRFLPIFVGAFDIEGVLAVLGPLGLDACRVTVGLGGLVGKSLVVALAEDAGLTYRLLDSARLYAAEQSKRDERWRAVRENYALYLTSVLESAAEEWLWRETTEWRAKYKQRLNDLRQVLDWCFDEEGRPDLGFRLTTVALLLWDEFSCVVEARARIEQALAYADTAECDTRSVANLAWARARAWALFNISKNSPDHLGFWEVAVAYAERSGDVEIQLRVFRSFAAYLSYTGQFGRALDVLRLFRELAIDNNEFSALPDGEWLVAAVEILVARVESARSRLEKLVRDCPLVGRRTRVARFILDRSMMLRTQYAFTLWIGGEPARALSVADEVCHFDENAQRLLSRLFHLTYARLPIAVWNNDLGAQARYFEMMRSYLDVENIQVWHPFRHFYQSLVEHYRGDKAALVRVREAIDRLIDSNMIARVPWYLATLAEAHLTNSELEAARCTLEDAQAIAARIGEALTAPELMRISAGISLASGERTLAITTLQRAKGAALDMGALYFALRAANDLAEIHLADGQALSAIRALRPIYARYSEGFDTYDLGRASRLLARAGDGALGCT